MEQYIISLILRISGPIRELAERVRDRFSAFWSTFIRVSRRIRSGWITLVLKINAMVGELIWHGWETYATLRYILIIRVPQLIANVRRIIGTWVIQFVDSWVRFLRGLITNVINWASKAINVVRSAVETLRRWALDRVNAIADLLNRTAKRVWDLLGDPRRLADWAAGAITNAILRYLAAKREAIGEWLVRRSVAFTLWFVRLIDDVIARIL